MIILIVAVFGVTIAGLWLLVLWTREHDLDLLIKATDLELKHLELAEKQKELEATKPLAQHIQGVSS